MSWDQIMPIITRALIGDFDTPSTYTDARLEQLNLIANKLMSFEIQFSQTYVSDLINLTLTPDPTLQNPPDDSFISLCCLKSALILIGGETNKSTGQSLQVRDGSSLIDIRNVATAKLALLENLQKQYNDAKLLYQITGSTGSIGQMIVTPFRLTSVPNALYPYPGILGHYI